MATRPIANKGPTIAPGCPSLARTRKRGRTPSPGRHRQQRVACRDSSPASRPDARSKDRHLPHRGRSRSRRRQHRSRRVAADRDGAAAIGIVGQRTTAEASEPGEGVADTLDHAQRRWRCSERRGQQTRQQCGRDFMPGICEKARRADALHTGRQPLGLRARHGIGSHRRRVCWTGNPPVAPNALMASLRDVRVVSSRISVTPLATAKPAE